LRSIEIDRPALLRDRARGLSLSQLAKPYKISRTSVARALKQSGTVPGNPGDQWETNNMKIAERLAIANGMGRKPCLLDFATSHQGS
jgi:hypothetical protein